MALAMTSCFAVNPCTEQQHPSFLKQPFDRALISGQGIPFQSIGVKLVPLTVAATLSCAFTLLRSAATPACPDPPCHPLTSF